jgi:hypothetical protein
MTNLVLPLPQKGTRSFWKCAKVQATVSPSASGAIYLSAAVPFRDFTPEVGWYRISRVKFSGNWQADDYARVIGDTTLETSSSTMGTILDQYSQPIFDDRIDLTEYFESDWASYWNNRATQNTLNFHFQINLVTDSVTLENYGNIFEARFFILIQQFNDERWIKAIEGGKI